MASAVGMTPSNFTLNLDLLKRRTTSTPAAPGQVESFSPQEREALAKLPTRAELLAQFQAHPETIGKTENAYGLQKKTSFETLEKGFLKTHTRDEEGKMMDGVIAQQNKAPGGIDRSQATLAMARLMAQSLKTQDAMKMEAEVAAAVEGGSRAGGAKYDLSQPKPAVASDAAKLLF